jgi:TolB protein
MLRLNAKWLCGAVMLGVAASAQAEFEITIKGDRSAATPVAVVPFGWSQTTEPPLDIAAVVHSDLAWSGIFAPIDRVDMPQNPIQPDAINFPAWRVLGVSYLLIGQTIPLGEDKYRVEARAYDVFKGLEGKRVANQFTESGENLRAVAHKISDIFYESVTGRRGVFSTNILYITVVKRGRDKRYALTLADADGYNPREIFISRTPLMSPAWSPDGSQVAYVSFEKGKQEIFVQHVGSSKRESIAKFSGLNGAPAWSPDGRKLAMTLSKDGNPEIYVMDLATRRLQRITRNAAIDTEPAWSPDGGALVFTSDRSGRPQIYRASITGGREERLTFEGKENMRPRLSPDGKFLAFVHSRPGAGYTIGLINLVNQDFKVLSNGPLDESPTFAPNSAMILYAAQEGGQGVLYSVPVEGADPSELRFSDGDVREPAWGPFAD